MNRTNRLAIVIISVALFGTLLAPGPARAGQVQPLYTPDLIPTGASLVATLSPSGFSAGYTYILSVAVLNQGQAPAAASTTALALNADSGQASVLYLATPSLLPGKSATLAFAVPGAFVKTHTYYVVTVDATNVVFEGTYGETNNTLTGSW